jgi:hypothetical protein
LELAANMLRWTHLTWWKEITTVYQASTLGIEHVSYRIANGAMD